MGARTYPYTHEVDRVSVTMVRATAARNRCASAALLWISAGRRQLLVELVEVAGSGAVAVEKRIRCPGCRAPSRVIGCYRGTWGCRACLRWRSLARSRRRKRSRETEDDSAPCRRSGDAPAYDYAPE